ncbi:MAG: hypothetical protein JXA54_13410 [Candidatus Heimdallarchaeota archaeon]|nr:hypothetical protein [Candidatus Heimdallarchaeota archaeon]
MERFVIWLDKFKDEDKNIVYKFIQENLIFISRQELLHLVSLVYYKAILPILLEIVSQKNKKPKYLITQHKNDPYFNILLRKCLFMGLSDGSMIGDFRRANNENSISHEQICSIYYIGKDKKDELTNELITALKNIQLPNEHLHLNNELSLNKFKVVFLLDDFTASGISFIDIKISKDNEKKEFIGKIPKAIKSIEEDPNLLEDSYLIVIILYIATIKAIKHIEEKMNEYILEKPNCIF